MCVFVCVCRNFGLGFGYNNVEPKFRFISVSVDHYGLEKLNLPHRRHRHHGDR